MRFEITEVHVVDIPDSEVEEMENPLEEIKDDAHWFIEAYGREGCKRFVFVPVPSPRGVLGRLKAKIGGLK